MAIFKKRTPSGPVPIAGSGEIPPVAVSTAEAAPRSIPAAAQPPHPVKNEPSVSRPCYGIEKAIELMRQLPVEDTNADLMVQVIRTTLDSAGVQVSSIIEDATQRQSDIQARATALKEEVASLKEQISRRSEEIAALEKDYQETTLVKDRLLRDGSSAATAPGSPAETPAPAAAPPPSASRAPEIDESRRWSGAKHADDTPIGVLTRPRDD